MNCGHRWAVSGDINVFFGLLHPRLKRIEPPPTQGRRRASSIFAVELYLASLATTDTGSVESFYSKPSCGTTGLQGP